jgi:hypothetical protein
MPGTWRQLRRGPHATLKWSPRLNRNPRCLSVLYCALSCRSASSCLNLNNVTLVVPTQEELNYQVFMYTMFNSPAPALRDLTSFYRDDLNTSIIQVNTAWVMLMGKSPWRGCYVGLCCVRATLFGGASSAEHVACTCRARQLGRRCGGMVHPVSCRVPAEGCH